MPRNAVLVVIVSSDAPMWDLTLPAELSLEVCLLSELQAQVQKKDYVVVVPPVAADKLVVLIPLLKGFPPGTPVVVALSTAQAAYRNVLHELGATDVPADTSAEHVNLVIQSLLVDKPAVEEPPPPGAWPTTVFDAAVCEKQLRDYAAASEMKEAAGGVRSTDLMKYARSLSAPDRDLLLNTEGSDKHAALKINALVIGLRLYGIARSAPKPGELATVHARVLTEMKTAVDAMAEELRQARASDPSRSGAELERFLIRLEGAWHEVDQLRSSVETRAAAAPAPVVEKTPLSLPREVRRPTAPTPAPVPSPPPVFVVPVKRRGQRELMVGAILVSILGALAWQIFATQVVESTPHYLLGIPAVTEIAAQQGRAIVRVGSGWVADDAHVTALKSELGKRGIVYAEVYDASAKRLAQLNIQLPAGVKRAP